jgi:hypothetical protein
MESHLFWDNSNIWGGALATKNEKEPTIPGAALRIHIGNVLRFSTSGKTVKSKTMGGSVPPECEDLWKKAKQLGINVDLLVRVDSEGTGQTKEQAVDEILHLKIANALLDYDTPQNLILLTGDGNKSDFDTSFSDQVKRALRKGWTVDLYSWQSTLNKRKYLKIAADNQKNFHIHILDYNYFHFTYIKEGEFYTKDKAGVKTYFEIKERKSKPLI